VYPLSAQFRALDLEAGFKSLGLGPIARACETAQFGRTLREVPFLLEEADRSVDLRLTTLALDPSSENKIMKLRKVLLSLSLAGICFSQVSAQDTSRSSRGRHIGDPQPSAMNAVSTASGSRTISDSSTVMPASTESGSRTISDKSGRSISDAGVGYATTSVEMSLIAPTAASFSRGGCDGGCDTCGEGIISGGCDGACDAIGGGACNSMWFSAETLLWFTNGGSTPPLVTTAPQGVFPVYGGTDVQTAFGGPDGIDQGMFVGFRLEAGTWIDDRQKIGVSGRVFGFDTNEEYSLASDGSTSIGIPFFNSNAAVLDEDAYLVAFTAAGPTPVSAGNVFVRSDLDLISAEGSIRALLAGSGGNRVDLLAGYTFARVRSSLTVNTQSENLFTGDLIPDGTIFDTNDLFETTNEFHGAHLGLLSTITRKGLSLITLAKVSFGNMRQTGQISGSTTETFGGASSTTAGGIFSQPSNIGTLGVNNEFAFIPELGTKLAYDVNDQLKATVGYTFLYYSSVALAGEQVDRSVDLTGTGTRPTANFVDGSLWTQGIDLGMIYSF
jgi:hypothetical protein